MKHDRLSRRLIGVHVTMTHLRPLRPILIALRTALAVVLAMLLILVVLPAALAAQAAAI
jgi:hypothetical protein